MKGIALHHGVSPWICCQLGGREHYAVPRALHQAGVLAALITDLWIDPAGQSVRFYPRRLRERFHPRLAGAIVKAANRSALLFEAQQSVQRANGWDVIVRRNDWFQRQALRELGRLAQRNPNRIFRLFSYSYTARRIFEFAKSRGWETVLGQIDPGPAGERIVSCLHNQHAAMTGMWQQAPASYWQAWREECQLADLVLVNSPWSHQALVDEQVPEEKIRIVPLAYEAPARAKHFQRRYPDSFGPQRPLRVLFLGQVTLGKGIAAILDAMRFLENEPVEFWFVGPRHLKLPADCLNSKQARWLGGVSRSEVSRYYQEADVFLFPTFSDGFGLTQLEAQAWKLPVIASRFCGAVVRDGVNGVLLQQVSGKAIAETIRPLVADPGRLRFLSRNAIAPACFGIDRLESQLLGLPAS